MLLPGVLARGFAYHHADAGAQTVMLTRWLCDDEKNMLPPSATTNLGVGAFVVNARSEALVILERYSHAADFWKLPGGAVDVDEELSSAAEREVKEETGVDCTFESVVAARHLHGYRFGRGDIYHVCVMRARDESQVCCVMIFFQFHALILNPASSMHRRV